MKTNRVSDSSTPLVPNAVPPQGITLELYNKLAGYVLGMSVYYSLCCVHQSVRPINFLFGETTIAAVIGIQWLYIFWVFFSGRSFRVPKYAATHLAVALSCTIGGLAWFASKSILIHKRQPIDFTVLRLIQLHGFLCNVHNIVFLCVTRHFYNISDEMTYTGA